MGKTIFIDADDLEAMLARAVRSALAPEPDPVEKAKADLKAFIEANYMVEEADFQAGPSDWDPTGTMWSNADKEPLPREGHRR